MVGFSLPELKGPIVFPQVVLEEICGIVVEEIIRAAKAEFARRRWSLLSPDGRTNITKSFKYVIKGDNSFEISSSFPGLENYATGIPLKRDPEGNIIVHHGALQLDNLWIHPGVGKRNFLNVGMEKGMKAAESVILEEVWRQMMAAGDSA